MALPDPTSSFTIPSLHDGTRLSCRLYAPPSPQTPRKRGAIVAHPYAPLGGCFDDPVVGEVGGVLLAEGFFVVTFNFRGAGDSGGRTSWTGRPEAADYATVAALLVLFLHGIEGSVADDGRGGGGGGGEDEGPPPDGQIDVVFAGYSYGSLVTTRLPDLAALLAPFSTLAPGESAREVAGRARKLAGQASGGALRPAAPGHGRRSSGQQQRQRQRQRREGGSAEGACAADEAEGEAGRGGVDGASPTATTTTTTPASRPETGGDPAPSTPSPPKTTVPQSPFPLALNTHYLLVSPLLPPISTLTALPLFSPDTDTDEAHLKKFRESPSLAVFGSRDIFTSARRLAAWCEERRGANARFDWFEVPGAGHFWHERGAMAEANRHVREWVRRSVGVK